MTNGQDEPGGQDWPVGQDGQVGQVGLVGQDGPLETNTTLLTSEFLLGRKEKNMGHLYTCELIAAGKNMKCTPSHVHPRKSNIGTKT